MRNIILVIKHEILKTIGKPSFWLTSFLLPLIIFVFTFGSQLMAERMTEDDDGGLEGMLQGETPGMAAPVGYVDHADLIMDIPDEVPEQSMRAYPSESEAEAALAADDISQYYVVSGDFVTSGDITLIQRSFSPFQSEHSLFQYVVYYNMTESDAVAGALLNPIQQWEGTSITDADDEGAGDQNGDTGFSFAPMIMLFVFFFVLTMSSGYMLRSVTKEKENSIVEVLLLSLRPRDLMLGKILGLGVVALLQMTIWLLGGTSVLREGIPVLDLTAPVNALPANFLIWAALYFLFGYLTFASALGVIGTLAPNLREGSQFTFVVMLPLMIPLWLNSTFAQAPNSPLVTFLSIFPLTSPVSMITRMTATTVPLWQTLLSLVLLAATTYGFVLLSARFFRADTLLSRSALNWKRIKKEFRRLT
jgi:ABC-2 type transport system permease protein